jgi:hypothetical protein
MMVKYRRKWCPHDQKLVLAHSRRLNNHLHGLISLATLGLWLPVWLVLVLRTDSRFFCPECGRPTGRPVRPPRPAAHAAAGEDQAGEDQE